MKKVISQEVAEKITQLRADGLGYKGISSKLGLKSDTVKKYCKRNNMSGYLGGVKKEGVDYVR